MLIPDLLDQLCLHTIRFLSLDAVQQADSRHPGMSLGARPMAHAVRGRQFKCNPRKPDRNRDRCGAAAPRRRPTSCSGNTALRSRTCSFARVLLSRLRAAHGQ
ncbi:MAG: hypothetical protein H7322_11595 [Ramlibacter sp.]|nr:hypothetical protein [Ramlibacter sp.]